MKARIKALEARVSVTNDLENQVSQLRKQLAAAQNSNQELEIQIKQLVEGTIRTLRAENSEMAKQIDESHT